MGFGGVVETLRTHLGEYLSDIVLYDAHEARRLVEQLREHPERGDDPSFSEQLERCGYASLQRALEQWRRTHQGPGRGSPAGSGPADTEP